jgi:hypothetical protein
MRHVNFDLLEKAFHPLRPSLGQRRPDGSVVLTLADSNDEMAYSRVISSDETVSAEVFGEVVAGVRRELCVRAGSLSSEIRKQLVDNAGVMSYVPV